MRRETTALQRKLETMAQQIGNFGLAAAVFSLAAMAGQFTWHTFYVEGQAWDLKYLSEYLSYVITAITIVVGCPANTPPCCAQGTLEQAVILKRLDVLSRTPSGTLTHHHPRWPMWAHWPFKGACGWQWPSGNQKSSDLRHRSLRRRHGV